MIVGATAARSWLRFNVDEAEKGIKHTKGESAQKTL